ncbi:MAG: SURF1 family protein [Woeseiaceae bacterium]|nr:SURF1 family protein [Woeseiaceae bacterium]
MNTNPEKSLPSWLPLVGGAVLVVQFAGLSAWQISRGMEKLDQRSAYSAEAGYSNFHDGAEVRAYQPLKASGSWQPDQQFVLDNIIFNSRNGYYVLTPLELKPGAPLLIVNRGWTPKSGPTPDLAAIAETIALDKSQVTVRGRVGALPRAGMRMGDAILPGDTWPVVALYPTAADLESKLEHPIQPFVLLMDPDESDGFVRHWVPEEMGPGKHFGYALQWFAMGAVLTGLLIWHYRRRGISDG